MSLEQKAGELIEKYKMVSPGDKILAGFSGGSDSSALLYFLVRKYGGENICGAHLNHGIRGDALADEQFAREICGKYGIELFVERADVPELARKYKKGVEEAGRDARYDFFARVCGEIGGSVKVCTAHNAGDNTESVLINLARGAGVGGLCGVSPVAGNIIRPLLSCEKRDILDYCRENNIGFIEDKSNADELYTRNFIRHSVAAKLKERYACLDSSVLRMSEIMRDTADYMDGQAAHILKDYAGGVPAVVFRGLHKALRRIIIIKMCGGLDFNLVEELDGAVMSGKLMRQDLPGNMAAEVRGGEFRVYMEADGYRAGRREQKRNKKI